MFLFENQYAKVTVTFDSVRICKFITRKSQVNYHVANITSGYIGTSSPKGLMLQIPPAVSVCHTRFSRKRIDRPSGRRLQWLDGAFPAKSALIPSSDSSSTF